MTLDNDREWVKKINQQTRKTPYYTQLSEKKYRHVKGYLEYEKVMFDLARTRYSYSYYDPEDLKKDFVHRNTLLSITDMLTDGFQSFWLSQDLFTAFLHTDLPKKLTSLNRVVKNCVLFLPEGLYSPDGTRVRWLLFNHRLANESLADISLAGKETIHTVENNMDTLSVVFYDAFSYQYSTNRPLHLINGKIIDTYENDHFILRTNEDADIEVEKEFLDRVFNLVVNVILFLQTYEEKEVSDYIGLKSNAKKRTKNTPKLNPYIIGEKYKTKRETYVNNTTSEDGVKKTTHWRRGHYRNQIVGKREEQSHKLVWIEPVLVNGVVE